MVWAALVNCPCSAVGCVMVWYCGHVVGLLVRWGEAPPECLEKRHDGTAAVARPRSLQT